MAKKAKSMSGGGRGRGPGPRNRRGRRGKHSKRSPFSGIERDMRARYERISQRDRKGQDLQIRATGKLVTLPAADAADGTAAAGAPIEAVEFNAADDPEAPGAAAAAASQDSAAAVEPADDSDEFAAGEDPDPDTADEDDAEDEDAEDDDEDA